MKKILLLTSLTCCYTISQAQLLKKLKDKVNKTISKDDDKKSDSGSSGNEGDNSDKNKVNWCDTMKVDGAGPDGVSYTKIYSSPTNIEIVYTECSLGINNDPLGYRLILTQRVNNKQQFIVVENGKVIDTDDKVKTQYLGKGTQSASSENTADEDIKKYVIADSTTLNIPKTDAKTVTVQEVDDDQASMALNIFKQTDEYKHMTPAQQKEAEENMKKGIASIIQWLEKKYR